MKPHKVAYILSSVFFAVFIGLLIYGVPLPPPSAILPEIARGAPLQTDIANAKPIEATFGKYRYLFTPHADYDISGLVVSLHHSNSLIDVSHKTDPAQTVDVCVVWGPNITTNGYREVKYDHGDFTCFYHWNTEYDPPFSGEYLSNNHLVPTTPEMAKLIASIRVGDQVRLKGRLVDYDISEGGHEVEWRHTSLVRTDTGNGACEIIYLTDAMILKRHMPWRGPLLSGSGIGAFVLLFVGFYLGMPKFSKAEPELPPEHPNPFDPARYANKRF